MIFRNKPDQNKKGERQEMGQEATAVLDTARLPGIWDAYTVDYKNIYRMPIFQHLRDSVEGLFIPVKDGVVLDAGCGTGGMFAPILRSLEPKSIVAVDFSKTMLQEAKWQASTLDSQKTAFKFLRVNLTRPLPWQDEVFAAELFSLTICYLPEPGWRYAVKEAFRTLEAGGYLYISTLLADWDFKEIIKRYTPSEFLKSPIGCYYGLRTKKHVTKIGAYEKAGLIEYPYKDDLLAFQQEIGLVDLKQVPVFWGAGLATRARKPK